LFLIVAKISPFNFAKIGKKLARRTTAEILKGEEKPPVWGGNFCKHQGRASQLIFMAVKPVLMPDKLVLTAGKLGSYSETSGKTEESCSRFAEHPSTCFGRGRGMFVWSKFGLRREFPREELGSGCWAGLGMREAEPPRKASGS
jgi:hypothetical protein